MSDEHSNLQNDHLDTSKIYQRRASTRHSEDELRCLDVRSQSWSVWLSVEVMFIETPHVHVAQPLHLGQNLNKEVYGNQGNCSC